MLYSLGNSKKMPVRMTENNPRPKLILEDRPLQASLKDDRKQTDGLNHVLTKFKDSSFDLKGYTLRSPFDNYQSVQNSSTKIKTLDAFLTSRRNSSKEKNSRSKRQQEDPAKAKKRLYLKDFSSSQGQINSVHASMNNFKLAQPKFDSANDSLVDQVSAMKPLRANISEPEVLTIRSDIIEDTETGFHDSFSNHQLSDLMDSLKMFIKSKDTTIGNLQDEVQRLRRILDHNHIKH